MKALKSDIDIQVLRLFQTAGLIEDAALAQYNDKYAKGRTIGDMLTKEVTLDSFRDLLFAEVSFKRTDKKLDRDLMQGLSATGMINDEELAALFATHRPRLDRTVDALKLDKVIDIETATRLLAEQAEAQSPRTERILAEKTIGAEAVCRWLSSPDCRQVRRLALYLAVQFLHFNNFLNDGELEDLAGLLQKGDADDAAKKLRAKLDFSAKGLAAFLDRDLNVPSVDLDAIHIEPGLFSQFPETLLRRQGFAPFLMDDDNLGLAMADPFNVTLAALLEWTTGRWPQPAFASSAQISERINRRGSVGAPKLEVEGRQPRPVPAEPRTDGRGRIENGAVADNLSTVQLVSSIIESAIDLRTTDIHIEPTRAGLTVRFRIDGDLRKIMAVPAAMSQPVVSRVKVLADMDVTDRRRPQDGHFELHVGDRNYDFRISTLPALLGEKIVIRILDSQRVKTTLESLGLLADQREAFEWMLGRAFGIILVTGPTGSGKSTTLYSGLNQLNSEARNLVTIEDPVEYQLEGINQVQVDPNIELGFAEGLRSILRQDPDVIMIGEIRDAATAHIAIRAALTGHLVLSTLHTNTAFGAIDALVNLGVMPFMLAESLTGIVAQRLLRVLCKECRKEVALSPLVRRELGIDAKKGAKKKIAEAKGCPACFNGGYLGRTGVFEVLKITEKLRPLIADQIADGREEILAEEGFTTLQQAAAVRILDQTTSVDEVRRRIMLEI